jgi:hypothetical protein
MRLRSWGETSEASAASVRARQLCRKADPGVADQADWSLQDDG